MELLELSWGLGLGPGLIMGGYDFDPVSASGLRRIEASIRAADKCLNVIPWVKAGNAAAGGPMANLVELRRFEPGAHLFCERDGARDIGLRR